MLTWKPGPKAYDGIWGVHWYKEINKTSGFIKKLILILTKRIWKIFQKKIKT